MYITDMPRIRAHALACPQGLTDVITFVLLTIQQPFQHMAMQFADVRQHGEASRFLFGTKRAGYRYAVEHAEVLFAAIKTAVEVQDVVGAIDVLTNVPNLGVVKAAFVAQCVGLDVACLDRHNLARLGMPETALKFPKKLKPETRREKITRYVDMCRTSGGPAYWWDSWCAHVAGRRKSPLKTAKEVSAFHVAALGLA
jgi:hypothetical protein